MTANFAPGFAPAKINLTLHITGQRADGYHLLDSLVAFADFGDHLTVTPASDMRLDVVGPEGEGVPTDYRNLILQAAALCPVADPHAFTLEKNLPTASGVGGGSSDAAAAIRLLKVDVDLQRVLKLGADIPMCITPKAARVQGIGDQISVVSNFPSLPAVLLNPRLSVPTPDVFSALLSKDNAPMQSMPKPGGDVIVWLAEQRNDLQGPAISLFPGIQSALSALEGTNGCQIVRMSGSGATCFALYRTDTEAENAAKDLTHSHPDWWVQSCRLGSMA
ncbi:4-(cytidine 5'-diphospho)-2-C-methyl-D-erythritol kinase [Halocynthiibacter namhaensis]|uniref:4-(cytidine 5'-diphospho)-2-C-methyl-D-erythritol kinase n=1 Tax=Halocynthiibacter namhaensis TaxID=1290553 RepID=UPI0005795A71|nr:4-(cytidine 5'-diphospho)-2-C-methyl-D-erythritol kinase [Halocynthiibacter namhaensis]